jgi:hypothetical protein
MLRSIQRQGIGLLELALGVAIIALILQLVPLPEWRTLVQLADVRTWSSYQWFWANACLFVAMVVLRFGAGFKAVLKSLMKRLGNWGARSSNSSEERKKLSLQEERKLYERMNEARKRQVI